MTVRALEALGKSASAFPGHDRIRSWCESTLAHESGRIAHAVENLVPICAALEAAGAQVAVIKSLDHWPDLGSDLDLYTDGDESTVLRVMAQQFHAVQEPRSWGDRLANKWNFKLPDLPELVEIHVRYLGQTGEQKALAGRVLERSVTTGPWAAITSACPRPKSASSSRPCSGCIAIFISGCAIWRILPACSRTAP